MGNTVKSKRGQPILSIIIVSYNTADLIGDCLKSVFAASNITKEIFVVDNASTDNSVILVEKDFPEVNVIVNMKNRGFAAANNQVIPLYKGKYIFFLNPDAKVMQDTFNKAILFMYTNPDTGLAGTKVVYPDGTFQWSVSNKYPGEKYTTNELCELPGSIACVLGASMIARSELIKGLKGFDEDFFLYGEDQDLCLRIRKSGYKIGYTDSARIIHLGGQSEKNSLSSEVWEKKINAEYIFYRKHYLPKTINRINRSNTIKALWRIITLKLFLPFAKDKTRMKEKLGKYRVIYYAVKNPIHQNSEKK